MKYWKANYLQAWNTRIQVSCYVPWIEDNILTEERYSSNINWISQEYFFINPDLDISNYINIFNIIEMSPKEAIWYLRNNTNLIEKSDWIFIIQEDNNEMHTEEITLIIA